MLRVHIDEARVLYLHARRGTASKVDIFPVNQRFASLRQPRRENEEIAGCWRRSAPGLLIPRGVVCWYGVVLLPTCAACCELFQSEDVTTQSKPEMCEPKRHFDRRADVYELGSCAIVLQDRLHCGACGIDFSPEPLVQLSRQGNARRNLQFANHPG